jgi:hypothetical protein
MHDHHDSHDAHGGEALEAADVYGVLGEFASAEELLEAAHATREAGYQRTDAYAPFPVHGLAAALGARSTRLPLIVLVGGICGGVLGYLLQYFCAAVDYPLNVGGRPPHSWPSFVPVTFELTILGAALSAVLGMLALNGLPQPHHPLFNVPEFSLASQNRFFLCIEATDPLFNVAEATDFLSRIGSTHVQVVEN